MAIPSIRTDLWSPAICSPLLDECIYTHSVAESFLSHLVRSYYPWHFPGWRVPLKSSWGRHLGPTVTQRLWVMWVPPVISNIDAPGAGWRRCWRLSLCSARPLIAVTVATPWTWSVTSAEATRRPRTSAAWWPPPSPRVRQQERLPTRG